MRMLRVGDICTRLIYDDGDLVKIEIVSVDDRFYWYRHVDGSVVSKASIPVDIGLMNGLVDRGEYDVTETQQ